MADLCSRVDITMRFDLVWNRQFRARGSISLVCKSAFLWSFQLSLFAAIARHYMLFCYYFWRSSTKQMERFYYIGILGSLCYGHKQGMRSSLDITSTKLIGGQLVQARWCLEQNRYERGLCFLLWKWKRDHASLAHTHTSQTVKWWHVKEKKPSFLLQRWIADSHLVTKSTPFSNNRWTHTLFSMLSNSIWIRWMWLLMIVIHSAIRPKLSVSIKLLRYPLNKRKQSRSHQ